MNWKSILRLKTFSCTREGICVYLHKEKSNGFAKAKPLFNCLIKKYL